MAEDVAAFDATNCLPPAIVEQLFPLGDDFSHADPRDVRAWAVETALDVEWLHAIAPGAHLLVLASPVAETEGVVGLPEFLALEQQVLDQHLGTVINQSWATSERWLDDDAGRAMEARFNQFYQQATADGITIVSASGDGGYSRGNVPWPASAPWVTAVGGTELSLDEHGGYGGERVWATGGASGSGVSHTYPAPAEQSAINVDLPGTLGGYRAEPDVAAVALNLGVMVTLRPGDLPTAHLNGGTSASTPIWAGILALAGQVAGHGLGNVNPALYALGANGMCLHDVVKGSNSFRGSLGQPARPGWDLATGWGTPDAPCLVPALARGKISLGQP